LDSTPQNKEESNKNYCILLSGELNDRTGNSEIRNIAGSFGEPVTNTNTLKLRDFGTYGNVKIMILFYKHKNVKIYTSPARNSKAIIDSFIIHRKLSELSLEVRDYLRSGTGSEQFLTLAKLRFPPKWLHLPKNAASKENILNYEIRLHNIENIRWLCKKKNSTQLQEIPESSNIVL